MTREDWLIRAANSLSQDLLSTYTLPAFHISVGFPRGRGGRAGPRAGECWPPKAARDGKAHIFVSPIRDVSEATAILAIVLHELIHAAVGTEVDRGQRPGSRLRLYECACPVKARVASDRFHARCEDCGSLFEGRGE